MSISQTPHWSPHACYRPSPCRRLQAFRRSQHQPANGRAGCAARKAACVAEWLGPITACPAGGRRGRNSLAHDREPDRAQLNCPVWKGFGDVMSRALLTQLDLSPRLSLGSAALCVCHQARDVCDTPVPPLMDVHAARCWPDLSASPQHRHRPTGTVEETDGLKASARTGCGRDGAGHHTHMQERVLAVGTSPISEPFAVRVPIALRESRELQERSDARPGISEIFPLHIASSNSELCHLRF